MKLTVINGSPRGKGSNSKILMDHFLRGFTTVCSTDFEVCYLNKRNNQKDYIDVFRQSESVILIFPLYTDAMPGIVKEFIELLAPLAGKEGIPDLGFVVQSGFPEAIHSRYVERYLEKLAKRMNAHYIGTVVKGGVEGIQIMPERMTGKLYRRFFDLGVHFGKTNEFEGGIVKKLAGFEKLRPSRRMFFKLMQLTGMANWYWNSQLKRNGAYHNRFNQAYLNDKSPVQ